MALFNPRILAETLKQPGALPAEHQTLLHHWAESVRDGSLVSQNETQIEGDFKSRILETVLGYASFGTGLPQTLKAKVLMGKGEVDLALGHFDTNTKIMQNPQIRALDGQKAVLKIGDRVPVATGSFQPGIGGVGINPLVNTQFQYLDVGLRRGSPVPRSKG